MTRTIRPKSVGGLVLFHGAGGDRDHHTFLALEESLAVPVMRCNFPYREKGPGRRPPDRMPKLIERVRESSADAAASFGCDAAQLVLGGRSMGGRAASMAVAEGLEAAGLLLLSYPLHPPGKPDKLRVDHFADVSVPALIIQGTKDPFGRPDEFSAHLRGLAGGHTVHWLEGAGHSPKKHDPEIVEVVRDWVS